MKSSNRWFLLALSATATACGGSGPGAPVLTPATPADNVLSVTVNGSLCAANSYQNKPCVQVTLCTPGTSICQTIDDILLDTGSYGLRVFQQALTIALPRMPAGSGVLATCVSFADGSSEWGPVARASVILASEPPVDVPVQVIDATFGVIPSTCTKPDSGPSIAGLNGILGVGVFAQDCGITCSANAGNGVYFACDGSGCSGVAVPLASQIQNPVSLLPLDSNGLIIELPSVRAGGTASLTGSVILGIGTRSNNAPSAVTTYALDANGAFNTVLGGTVTPGYLDTGSNGLFFAAPRAVTIPACPTPDNTWFCPIPAVQLSATNSAASGPASTAIGFEIGDFEALLASSNNVFAEIGGPALPPDGFDWGLPFHFGRRVYVGIENQTSTLGTGPYVAY